jgi:hypothetical protein
MLHGKTKYEPNVTGLPTYNLDEFFGKKEVGRGGFASIFLQASQSEVKTCEGCIDHAWHKWPRNRSCHLTQFPF